MAGVERRWVTTKLKAERAADGAARRSAHRGSWETNKFERWRAAIENYEPSVKLGNQTSLNAARVPFATYINAIHNRLHPIFAEEFLASLDNLPTSHALNQNLVTHIEIVLSKDDGRIVADGRHQARAAMTAFDIVALNSVSRASPFGKAPDAIVSPDGRGNIQAPCRSRQSSRARVQRPAPRPRSRYSALARAFAHYFRQ